MDIEALVLSQQSQSDALVQELATCNSKTRQSGLLLSEQQMKGLIERRFEALKETRRVEFGRGILPDLIETFCSSPYLSQDTYVETIAWLQDAFYRFKEETDEQVSDDDLIGAMRTLFDDEAHGSQEVFESVSPSRLIALAQRSNQDANEDWSESDAHSNDKEEDEKPEENRETTDRIYEGGSHHRPDNEYASNFYDSYYELYRTGFDFNSRIGGSSL